MRKLSEEKLKAERERLLKMWEFEDKYSVYSYICGVDEAGRGPLAGPVVAGACILDRNEEILFLNDSKKLSEKRRETLFPEIMEKAVAYGIGIAGPELVDEINILQATYRAMREAVSMCSYMLEKKTGTVSCPELLLNDAVNIPDINIKQIAIVHGDARSLSIAAASVLAKVTRDKMMLKYDEEYPEYGFAKHKGYGTKQHIEALKKYGLCPIHRKSFIGHFTDVGGATGAKT